MINLACSKSSILPVKRIYRSQRSMDPRRRRFPLVYSISARATFERVERFRSQISRVKTKNHIQSPSCWLGINAIRSTRGKSPRRKDKHLRIVLDASLSSQVQRPVSTSRGPTNTVVRMIREQREGTVTIRRRRRSLVAISFDTARGLPRTVEGDRSRRGCSSQYQASGKDKKLRQARTSVHSLSVVCEWTLCFHPSRAVSWL